MHIPAQANGTIFPARFVSFDPTAGGVGDNKVIETAAATLPVVGVSQLGTDFPPINDPHVTLNNVAAIKGEQLDVFGVGEICAIELAEAVKAGDLLKAGSANGKAVKAPTDGTVSTKQFVGGFAMQSGAPGEKIKMVVHPMVV